MKKTAIPREIMIVKRRKLNLHNLLRKHNMIQRDVKKNAKHKRTMYMWKNALEHAWNTRPIEHT